MSTAQVTRARFPLVALGAVLILQPGAVPPPGAKCHPVEIPMPVVLYLGGKPREQTQMMTVTVCEVDEKKKE